MGVQMLTHIGICVSDLGRARPFYTNVLGLEEVGRLATSGATVDALLGLVGVDVEAVYLGAERHPLLSRWRQLRLRGSPSAS